jgi:hypothetical protein
MLSEESHRLFVMHDFEGHHPGAGFNHWPQHITLTPLFTHLGISKEEVINHIVEAVSLVKPFNIEACEEVLYSYSPALTQN